MGDLDRVLFRGEKATATNEQLLSEYLDQVELDRQTLIMKLRHADRVLMRYGRLRLPTIPERTK